MNCLWSPSNVELAASLDSKIEHLLLCYVFQHLFALFSNHTELIMPSDLQSTSQALRDATSVPHSRNSLSCAVWFVA